MTERDNQSSMREYPAYPDTGEEEITQTRPEATIRAIQDQEQQRQLHSRRGFLRMTGRAATIAGVSAAGGMELFRTDTFFGETLSPQTPLTLEHIAGPETPAMNRYATLFIPGFNVSSAVPAAKAIAGEVSRHGNVVALTHASDHFSIDALESQIRAYLDENDMTSLSLLGSSLGGLISMELASRISQVDLVIADSSPADPSDARELPSGFSKQLLEGASWALDRLDLSGGPAIRTATEFVKRLHDGDKSTITCLQEALAQDYSKSCPNALVLDLYIFMMTHNIQSKDTLPGQTALVYLGADDPARDGVIDQQSASQKYGQFALDRNIPFAHVTSPDTAHADIATHGPAYTASYRQAMDSISLQREMRFRRSLGTVGFRILGR